jgi:hypothetical protein
MIGDLPEHVISNHNQRQGDACNQEQMSPPAHALTRLSQGRRRMKYLFAYTIVIDSIESNEIITDPLKLVKRRGISLDEYF